MLILGKCLYLCQATSKHSVTVSCGLLQTGERPGSSLGPQLFPKWECALLLSLCVGRVLSTGGDTCTGQELNPNCAFLLQDYTCRSEEVEQGWKEKGQREKRYQ